MNVNQLLIQAFGPLISSFWWLIPLLYYRSDPEDAIH